MSIELVRDLINYENMVGEGTGQTMVSGDIMLGERSREIMNILHMDGKASITSIECFEDKVSVEGKMDFELLYSTRGERQWLNKVNAVSGFSHTIQIPGARPGMLCKADLRMEHIGYEQINNRKIKVNAIVNLLGKVYQNNTAEAIVDIRTQDIQVLRNGIAIDEFVSENRGQSIVKGSLEHPEKDVAVNTVLKRDIDIVRKNIHISGDRIAVNAAAQIRILFDDENGNLHTGEQEVPFNCEFHVQGLKDDMKCDIGFRVEDAYDEVREDENGVRRIIDTELVVEYMGKIWARKEIENVIDAYSPGRRYEMEKEVLRPSSFFSQGTGSETLNEKIELPEETKPVKKVLSCIAKPVLTEIKPLEDKITAEGVVNCCFIYEKPSKPESGDADGDADIYEMPLLSSHEEEIPFKSVIEMPGVRIDMLPEAELVLNNISYELLHEKELVVRMTVTAFAKVYSRITADLSVGAYETELPENIINMPSLVIYTVQACDSLWKIAKKFNTIIEDIVELNEIENPDMLQVGRKLLIPKKSFMK